MKKITIIFLLIITQCSFFICFAQQPTQEWVQRFTGNNYASGISIKMDSVGNVYVLMKLSSDITSGDYGLVKYSNIGNLIWSTYYNSPGNLNDVPQAFAVTASGDVYITGYTDSSFTSHNTLVKYNANGILQWAKIYINGGFSDISLDKNGNIILVGGTGGNTGKALILKYNNNGDSLWERNIQAPTNSNFLERVSIDDSNNIYCVGYFNDLDYLVLKYDQGGNFKWSTTYDSPQHYSDGADYIALDSNANVYVIGTSNVPGALLNNTLLKLNPNGMILWSRTFTGILNGQGRCEYPAGIAVTSNGHSIYYTTFCDNGISYDIVTLKYNAVGDTDWVRRYGGGANYTLGNQPSDIKLDKYNNIYVVGTGYSQSTNKDFVLIKYLPNGIQQWVASYNGPLSNSNDYAYSLCLDSNSNVFVTGISSRQNQPVFLWDAATIKYNQPNGIQKISSAIPKEFRLGQNFPNPFNPETRFKFEMPQNGMVEIKVYDIEGRVISTLVDEDLKPGVYEVEWNAENYSSGVYFYTISSGNFRETKRAILIK